jgi:metallophosphoesterase superfamily enzyme
MIRILPGNHDGNLISLVPEDIQILSSRGIRIGNVGFFHGHTWPSPDIIDCKVLVMGHVHPVVFFKDPSGFRVIKQVWVKANITRTVLRRDVLKHGRSGNTYVPAELEGFPNCGRQTSGCRLVIMPSFNDFLGGQPINKPTFGEENAFEGLIGPILRSESIDFQKAEVCLLDGTYLGNVFHLRAVDKLIK